MENQVEKKTNGWAIAGLLCSLFIGSITGLIFSIIGLKKVKECNSGKGLSIAGIIISVIRLLFLVLFIFLFFSVMKTDEFKDQFCDTLAKDKQYEQACSKNDDGSYNCIFATCNFDTKKEVEKEEKKKSSLDYEIVDGEIAQSLLINKKETNIKGMIIRVAEFDNFIIAITSDGYLREVYYIPEDESTNAIDIQTINKQFKDKLFIGNVTPSLNGNQLTFKVERVVDGYLDWYCHLTEFKIDNKSIAEFTITYDIKDNKLTNEQIGSKVTIEEKYKDHKCTTDEPKKEETKEDTNKPKEDTNVTKIKEGSIKVKSTTETIKQDVYYGGQNHTITYKAEYTDPMTGKTTILIDDKKAIETGIIAGNIEFKVLGNENDDYLYLIYYQPWEYDGVIINKEGKVLKTYSTFVDDELCTIILKNSDDFKNVLYIKDGKLYYHKYVDNSRDENDKVKLELIEVTVSNNKVVEKTISTKDGYFAQCTF